jgi:multiple sugar transport system substrate-binding protein
MEKITRRKFIGTAAAAGAATAVAACAPAATPAPTAVPTTAPTAVPAVKPTTAPAQPTAVPPTAAPTAVPTAAQPLKGTTIKVYVQDMDVFQYVKTKLPDFEKATGIKTELEFVSWAIILQQGEVELSSGSSTYDVTINPFVKSVRYMRAGWEAPLDDFIAKEKWPLDDFIPTVLDAHKYKGVQYALPYLVESSQMMYRKDILDAAGLKVPKTFDELETVLAKINKPKEFYAWVFRTQTAGFHFPFPIFLQGFGGNVFKNYPDDMTPLLNTPESTAAYDFVTRNILKYSVQGGQVYDTPDCQNVMSAGTCGIWIDALGILSPILDATKSKVADKVALMLPPAGPKAQSPQFATHGLCIPAGSKKKEAAWQFIKWATSAEILKGAAIESTSSPCPRKSVLISPEYAKKYTIAGSNLGQVILDAVSMAKAAYRTAPEFSEIGARMGQAAGEILTSQKTLKVALDSLQTDVETILKKAGYKI